MYFLLERVDSHCYVSLPNGNEIYAERFVVQRGSRVFDAF